MAHIKTLMSRDYFLNACYRSYCENFIRALLLLFFLMFCKLTFNDRVRVSCVRKQVQKSNVLKFR